MVGKNLAPIIIKRKKVIMAAGHHGGAWKVAYADFVTVMMAFFMLMWLLNATTSTQRKGLADYFQPTIVMSRISGGGDGMLAGDSLFSDEGLAHNSASVVLLQTDEDGSAWSQDANAQNVALLLVDLGGKRSVHFPLQGHEFNWAILHIISGCLFRMMSRYLAKVAKFVTH